MTDVKPSRATADHAVASMGWLMKSLSRAIAQEDWDGLRPSHFRLLSSVTPDGVRITDLAERLGMTKQAVGQFVPHLVTGGYLTVRADASDRRTRLVQRTARGNRAVVAFDERVRAMEDEWAARVGPRRYATFRAVLDELASAQRR